MKSNRAAKFWIDVAQFYDEWQEEHGELSTDEIVLVLSRWIWGEMKRKDEEAAR